MLAEDILDELDAARVLYMPRLDLDLPRAAWDPGSQRPLPFGDLRRFGSPAQPPRRVRL